MSGHKKTTVTIGEEEYRRLHEAETKLRLIQKSSVDEYTTQQYRQSLQNEYDNLQQRYQSYQSTIQELNDQIRQVEGDINQRLACQQENFFVQIDQLAENLWSQANHVIDEQQQQYKVQIGELHNKTNAQAKRLDRILRALKTDYERKSSIALDWIQSGEKIVNFINSHYDHPKFTPGKLNKIVQEIEIAHRNLEAGIPEAALTIAQQAYLQSSQLRIELECTQNEWNLAYIAASEMTDRVYALASQNLQIPAIDLNGQELDIFIDVDYWSGGALSNIFHNLEEVRVDLIENWHDLDLNQLEALRTDRLVQIEEEIYDCRFQTRLRVLSSQVRINIADIALLALERQGFTLQTCGYDRHDQRCAFTASTRNLDGSEVVIQVTPSDLDLGKNDLHVHSKDAELRTLHELKLRSETLRQVLSNCGLEVGAMTIDKGNTSSPYPQRFIPNRRVSESGKKAMYRVQP